MAAPPVQILSADAELADPAVWLPDTTAAAPPLVIALTGPQASGKSTLANALFATAFPVAARGTVASATTRGIQLARVARPDADVIVLDVEGADARARGRDAKAFAARCAAFVTALADVVLVNLWFHDACRVDSAAHSLISSVLHTCAQGLVDGAASRTALLVTVRDVDDESPDSQEQISAMVQNDVSCVTR